MTRLLDIVISFVAIFVLLPFMMPIMLVLALTGEHRVFYLQTRTGRGGREFSVFKFATMLKDSPNLLGGYITQKEDPRILPMGKFLRTTKINEIPQLLNILAGQMSFVGPRPVVAQHLILYSEEAREGILAMRPGLTGVASLIFRDEEGILDRMHGDRKENHDLVIAPYKGKLELWYREHRSLRLYFVLIGLTAWAVIAPSSSVYKRVFKELPIAPTELHNFI